MGIRSYSPGIESPRLDGRNLVGLSHQCGGNCKRQKQQTPRNRPPCSPAFAIPLAAPDDSATGVQLTGHKTVAVFRRYDIINERDLIEGVEKLAAGLVVTEQLQMGTVTRLRAAGDGRT